MRTLCWATLALVLASGCGGRGLPLDRWTTVSGVASPGDVQLPAHLDVAEPRPAAIVLRRTVQVPEAWRGQQLTLTFDKLGALATLQADGADAVPLDVDTWATYRVAGAQSFRVPAAATGDGAVVLELSLATTWTQSPWLDVVPRLSRTDGGDRAFLALRSWNDVTSAFGLTAALVTAALFALLFLRDRRRTDSGWFALEAACGALYPALNLNLLQGAVGDFDVPLAAMGVAGAGVAGVHMMHTFLKRPPPSGLWRIGWVVLSLVMVAQRDPFHATRWAAAPAGVFLAVAAVAMVWTYAKAARQGDVGALTLAIGWGAVLVLGGIDILGWLGLGAFTFGVQGAGLAIFSIAVAQAVNLSREHIAALAKADKLNAELSDRLRALEEKHKEVGQLNEELRHQLKSRSAELANGFSRDTARTDGKTEELVPGTVVNERYRIEGPLGTGGMGVVYRATRLTDQKPCAVKVIKHRRTSDQLARLSREAMVLADISHPNVVGIYDINVSGSGQLYLVMELVEGEPLDKLQERFGSLAFGKPVLAQTASALEAVHSRGFLHRDLKPANILLQSSGGVERVKVVDFGLAGLLDTDLPSLIELASTVGNLPTLESPARRPLTETGAILGTPLYMAPELVSGTRDVGPAADIFSFGIVAYEVLSAKRPFKELPISAAVSGRVLTPEVPLSELCPKLEPSVAKLLSRCLEAHPEARPRASELASALGAAAPSAP